MANCTPEMMGIGEKLESLFNNLNTYDEASWKEAARTGLVELAAMYKEASAECEGYIELPELNTCPEA